MPNCFNVVSSFRSEQPRRSASCFEVRSSCIVFARCQSMRHIVQSRGRVPGSMKASANVFCPQVAANPTNPREQPFREFGLFSATSSANFPARMTVARWTLCSVASLAAVSTLLLFATRSVRVPLFNLLRLYLLPSASLNASGERLRRPSVPGHRWRARSKWRPSHVRISGPSAPPLVHSTCREASSPTIAMCA